MTEQEKMIETVMAFSPIERQIDMYGCEIGVSRQWYNEATAILMEINEGKYLKIPDGAVVLTKEEYEKLKNKSLFAVIKYDEDKMKEIAKKVAKSIILGFTEKGKDEIRKETAKEILNIGKKLYEMAYHKSNAMPRLIEWIKVEYGVEVEE